MNEQIHEPSMLFRPCASLYIIAFVFPALALLADRITTIPVSPGSFF